MRWAQGAGDQIATASVMAPQQPGFQSIIIVGAGPSGLLLALLLAQLKPRPEITLLDAAPTLNTAPRATHYGPPAIKMLRKAGVLAKVREGGYLPKRICWRKLDGTRITGLDRSLLHDDGLDGDGLTVMPVGELCGLFERELAKRGVKVCWNSKVTAITSGLEEHDTIASVEAEEDCQVKIFSADYIVGCDGGNSQMRRLMFGKRNFPGFSWDEQVVATNTQIDLDRFGWEDTNFVVDNEHWFMAARIGPHPDPAKNLWRISYGELPGLSNEELMDRQEMKFEKMLPGHPKPDQYKVLSKAPYRVHQRIVDTMKKGRVMLAADAAHLCNPFGGLGLTGGIIDVGELADCLANIHGNLANDSLLEVWAKARREKYNTIVNPTSQANIRRLFAQNPDTALDDDAYLQAVLKAETDLEFSKFLQNIGYELLYDYSQHYPQQTNNAGPQPVGKQEMEHVESAGRSREDSVLAPPIAS